MLAQALTALGPAGAGLTPVRVLQQTRHKLSLLAQRGSEQLVLRIDRAETRVPGLDRDAELAVLRWAAAAGLGPEPVAACTAVPAVLLTRYIQGRAWTLEDLQSPARLAQAGRLLRRLHDAWSSGAAAASAANRPLPGGAASAANSSRVPPEAGEASFAAGESRLKLLPHPAAAPRPAAAPQLAALPGHPALPELSSLLNAYATHIGTPAARHLADEALSLLPDPPPGQAVLCHRDPTAPNLLETPDGQLLLLDWEYAGPGDPLYDLAVMIEHHALDDAAASQLLAAWSPQPTPGERERLERARRAYCLVARLWEQLPA